MNAMLWMAGAVLHPNRTKEKKMTISRTNVESLMNNANPPALVQAAKKKFRQRFSLWFAGALALGILAAMAVQAAGSSVAAVQKDDQKQIAALDTQYQAAVKVNDAATMDRHLADDFVLVTGSGKIYTKADLLKDARGGQTHYDHNEDTDQTVRVWGNTAVITAKLREAGASNGKPFDATLWFSDTYVRTPAGWKYVFGQSSLPLPKATQ